MRRSVDADKLMDGLGRLATDTDLCKRYGNCTPWIPYSAIRKLISDMILEEKESCDDAVNRQEAIDKIKKRLFETAFNNVGIKQNIDETLVDVVENRLENWFNELPSAEPERLKGKWAYDNGLKQFFCDQCGEPSLTYDDIYIYSMDFTNFCPNCGADMRGEAE